MRAFGARGFVSQEQLKRDAAMIAAMRRERRKRDIARERERIAALSNPDIVKIMARAIVEAVRAGRAVEKSDMTRAGVPEHRIAPNRDAAMRAARRIEPRLDHMARQP
ncbi:MAG: hypothetical protein JO256_09145 [Alphaproteobacteria bacterium]|nr:hypothetical protein [Alphaproteobacteria bacterium]